MKAFSYATKKLREKISAYRKLSDVHHGSQAPPKDGQGEVTPAQIELPIVSRFRFYEVADGPGRGCGPANIAKFVPGFDVPSGHNADAAAAVSKSAVP